MVRCSKEGCKKKLPIVSYPCKCNHNFCDLHKYPEEHTCSFDYFQENQKKMQNNLSTIVYTKKEIMLNQ